MNRTRLCQRDRYYGKAGKTLPKRSSIPNKPEGIKKALLWLIHPLQGAAVVIFYYYAKPVLAVLWFYGWLAYERQEYRQDKDTCYIDIRDFLIGFFTSVSIATYLTIRSKNKRAYVPPS